MYEVKQIKNYKNFIFFKGKNKSFMYYKDRITEPKIKIKNSHILFKCRKYCDVFYIKRSENNLKKIKQILKV